MKNFDQFVFENENKNTFNVSKGGYGWKCLYKTELGKGNALLFDNNTKLKSPIGLKDNEMFLFGIDVKPQNKGIGRMFLKKIFEHFNLEKLYLPSDEKHEVWNKIATKTDKTIVMGSKESTIFTLNKNQL